MPQRIPRRTLLATGAAGLAGLAGCNALGGGGDDDDESEGSDQGWAVPMGMIRPTDGSLSILGEKMKMAADFAVEQVDAAPTQFGIDMTIKDTDGSADAAVQAASELVEEGNQILVGPADDDAAIAVLEDVVMEEEIIAISPVAAATELTDMESKVTKEDVHNQPLELQYLSAPTAAQTSTRMSTHIALQRQTYPTIGVLHEDTPYGNSVNDELGGFLGDRDVEVTARVSVPGPDADSYTDQIDELMSNEPDAVVLATDTETGIGVLQDWYADYGEVPLVMGERLLLPEVEAEIDADMEGDLAVARQPEWMNEQPSEPTVNEVDTIAAPFHWAWLYKYNDWPSIHAAQTFDAILPMFLAAIRAREDDYNGPEISYAIRHTSNRQEDSGGITPAGVDYETFFDTTSLGDPFLLGIADGQVNNYAGPTGGVNFSDEGVMGGSGIELWHFNADTLWGFRKFDPFAED